MLLRATPITTALFAVALLIALATAALIALAFSRRRRHRNRFRVLDEARRRCRPIVRSILEGRIDYDAGFESLRQAFPGRIRLESILPTEPLPRSQARILLRLCEDLGLIELWRQQLSPKSSAGPRSLAPGISPGLMERLAPLRFVNRAESAERLGAVGHTASWGLLAEALDDPSGDVRDVAVRSLGLILAPESFPVLVSRLQAAALGEPLAPSARQIKSAVVRFPLERSAELLPFLRHPDGRVRSLAADIVRGMAEREAAMGTGGAIDARRLAPELASLFLEQLPTDANPNVRAHAAAFIARLPDPRAVPAFAALLEDPKWFVRLHAVRSLGETQPRAMLEPAARRLSDANWRVREAAARTLSRWGEAGVNLLLQHFLASEDCYSREQIAETLRDDGLMSQLLAHYGEAGRERDSNVIDALMRMGKCASVLAAIDRLDENQRESSLRRLASAGGTASLVKAREVAGPHSDLHSRAASGSGQAGGTQRP